MKIIYKKYWDFPLEQADLPEGKKIIENRRVLSLNIYKETDKNIELMNKHNKILNQIQELQREMSNITKQMEELINPY